MFASLKLCTILALATSFVTVSALDIKDITGNAVPGGEITLTWTTTASDTQNAMSMELNHPTFHDALAIANNVPIADHNRTLTLPVVAAQDNYWITFVAIDDINNVFSTSKFFAIGAEGSTQSIDVKVSATPTQKTTAKSSSVPATSAPSAAQTGGVSISNPPSASATVPISGSDSLSNPSSAPSASTTPPPSGALPLHGSSNVFFMGLGVVVAGAFAL